MHKCRFSRFAKDYLNNQLSVKDKTNFSEHLKDCIVCSREIERLAKLKEQLHAWQVASAPEGFEGSVQKKIVAWELERGEEKMKPKTKMILVPAGVLVGILVFFVVVNYMGRSMQGRLRQSPDSIGKQFDPTTGYQPLTVSHGSQARQQYEPYYITKGAYDMSSRIQTIAEDGIHDAVGGKRELVGESFGYPGGFKTKLPGVQYPPQSEFFEEEYSRIYDNDFLLVKDDPLSTFSIDVDTAAYSNARRFLNNNQLPPVDAVRIEELVNYFTYDYPQPTGTDPFSINTEVAGCPWNTTHKLVLVGLQGKKMEMQNLPPSNLVFLIDVSGSMQDYNKLPLLKSAFRLLVSQLRQEDKVSIVVYAGSSGVVLDSVSGDAKDRIMQAIENLRAGGSTAGAEGIVKAYELAKKNFLPNGNNRIILATDGDFNVGVTSESELVRMIEERRDEGIFLTILGFGMGNYKDAKMEKLADKGNGSIAYIDNLLEAKKVFVSQLTGTLFTIAKDVKIQVEFNPAQVKAYRLIGYENRRLENKDFNDDKKDAGELGAGHTVTALYELVPADSQEQFSQTDDLKYQKVSVTPSDELLTVKLRYKEPTGDTSKLLTKVINVKEGTVQPSESLRFASSVAEFGLLLRNSQYKANADYQSVLERARLAKGADSDGYRADFIKLVEIAQMLDNRK
jgi:Ca-activated chloride channel family protein